MSARLDAIVDQLPSEPGVYLFKDRRGKVLYVGKAKALRARVRQYLSGHDGRAMVPFLIRAAANVEVVVVRTEKEALILENTLIKKHRPRYNVKLVDDSSFLHLHIDLDAPWPRFQLVRQIRPGKSKSRVRHFGPFASASRARSTLDFLSRRFPLRTCSDRELQTRTRPCLLHQMGRCVAPCVDLCTPDEYTSALQEALLFLDGRNQDLSDRLTERMTRAAAQERYEDAARARDLIRDIQATMERQHVVDQNLSNRDVWGLSRSGEHGVAALMPVRRGMLQEPILLNVDGRQAEDGDLLSTLLNAWYGRGAEVPAEVLVCALPADADALAEVLSERREAPVRLHAPQRGDKLRLVELAVDNARTALTRRESDDDRRLRAMEELRRLARLPRLPRRIECFDNSNIQGTDPVAAMVVFIDGQQSRKDYRRYRVKDVVGSDDYATMREILGRRLRRGLREENLPDLLVVDGGKGQLNAALAIFRELGIADQRTAQTVAGQGMPMVPVIGLAKPRTEHARGDRDASDKIALPGAKDLIRPGHHSPALALLQAIRDQSHDTAVEYHRKVRRGRTLTSSLDDIPGVGPTRRKALLRHFGSLRALKLATAEQIGEVDRFGPELAQRIAAALQESTS